MTATNYSMTRNIQDVVPLLADHFLEIETDATILENNQKLVVENAHRLGPFYKYLGLLHDSWFLKTNLTNDKFSITLNDFTTHVFSDVIVERQKLNISHDKLVFPIQIDFEITNLTFNRVDVNGNIRSIEPTMINEYLYEQIISIDKDNIEIGLVVWKDGIKNKFGQDILILMSAKKITLTEFQDKAWVELFGNIYDNYYKYFKTQLDKGRYLSDQSLCSKLIDEYEGLKDGK
jgi:hypothetical protein